MSYHILKLRRKNGTFYVTFNMIFFPLWALHDEMNRFGGHEDLKMFTESKTGPSRGQVIQSRHTEVWKWKLKHFIIILLTNIVIKAPTTGWEKKVNWLKMEALIIWLSFFKPVWCCNMLLSTCFLLEQCKFFWNPEQTKSSKLRGNKLPFTYFLQVLYQIFSFVKFKNSAGFDPLGASDLNLEKKAYGSLYSAQHQVNFLVLFK